MKGPIRSAYEGLLMKGPIRSAYEGPNKVCLCRVQ